MKKIKSLFKFEVFESVIEFLKTQNEYKELKGNVQGKNFKLNQCDEFNLDTVDGYIANKYYGV
ncbi:hypothetical protein [Paraclostridium bifermentans]|uniref:hypothetical protein n=1 Tax=Paraclostridium bifermentans TaxID=1490 RepID=UPI0011DD182D|nr:hypothetical protein [Paraclostridium bifermentans]MDU3804294.1 hypothetical protein [Paraclostridium bifermentans]